MAGPVLGLLSPARYRDIPVQDGLGEAARRMVGRKVKLSDETWWQVLAYRPGYLHLARLLH